MPNNFNIESLFASAFGVRGVPFQVPEPTHVTDGEQFPQIPDQGNPDDSTFINIRNYIGAKSVLGKPIFAPVRIDGLLLPNEPTMFLHSAKEIVKTTLIGQKVNRGSVKELITTGDYEITIRGIAINHANSTSYPEDIIDQLNKLYLKNEAVDIESGLCALLGIYRIVIEDIDFPFTASQHCQAYEIRAWSDEDFSLYLTE